MPGRPPRGSGRRDAQRALDRRLAPAGGRRDREPHREARFAPGFAAAAGSLSRTVRRLAVSLTVVAGSVARCPANETVPVTRAVAAVLLDIHVIRRPCATGLATVPSDTVRAADRRDRRRGRRRGRRRRRGRGRSAGPPRPARRPRAWASRAPASGWGPRRRRSRPRPSRTGRTSSRPGARCRRPPRPVRVGELEAVAARRAGRERPEARARERGELAGEHRLRSGRVDAPRRSSTPASGPDAPLPTA